MVIYVLLCGIIANMNNKIFKSILITILSFSLIFVFACAEDEIVNQQPSNNLVSNSVLSESSYSLGDYMGDYTVTDVNGNEYVFSELLKSKKAIVLNFWYVSCGPCQMEFPYLQAAADKYSDDVVVLAINPTDDRENHIQKYATQNELSIPLIKGDIAWNYALNIRAFPTTVVIDRYGGVAFSHVGAVTTEGVFENIFEFYTSDNYTKTTIKNINDFK